MYQNKAKLALVAVAGISIGLNFLIFAIAYPEIFKIDSGCCAHVALAKDFSAYYTACWRLLHDPSNVYTKGVLQDGGPVISPQPESFKYLPSFLILFILPYIGFTYYNALVLFDITQFVLLFPLAFMLYRLFSGRRAIVISILLVIALLLPFPVPPAWGITSGYFWQWAEGQSKVLELFLLIFSFYLAKKSPFWSGIVFGLAFFDPRFALVSIPLFAAFNKGKVKTASLGTLLSLVVPNLPLVIIPAMGTGFLAMLQEGGALTPLYPYAYIPLITIIALTLVCSREIISTFRDFFWKAKEDGKQKESLT